jgi:hypothetical protein
LIDQKQYFAIHAARQSGKTTYLKDLTQRLNAGGKYYALYCSLEGMQGITDPKTGLPATVRNLKSSLKYSTFPDGKEFAADVDYEDFSNILYCTRHSSVHCPSG